MDNLLDSTEVGVIFLDDSLTVRKFTPHAAQLFNLVVADVGRPFDHFRHNIDYEDLLVDVEQARTHGNSSEKEVRDRNGRWHLLRIVPYQSKNRTRGVVISLIDVNSLREAEIELQNRDLERQAILRNSPAFIFIKDLQGVYTVASGQAPIHLGPGHDSILGKTDHDLLPRLAADRMAAQDRQIA